MTPGWLPGDIKTPGEVPDEALDPKEVFGGGVPRWLDIIKYLPTIELSNHC